MYNQCILLISLAFFLTLNSIQASGLKRLDGPQNFSAYPNFNLINVNEGDHEVDNERSKLLAKQYLMQTVNLDPNIYDLRITRSYTDHKVQHITMQMLIEETIIINTAFTIHIQDGELIQVGGLVLSDLQDHLFYIKDLESTILEKEQFLKQLEEGNNIGIDQNKLQFVYYYQHEKIIPCYMIEISHNERNDFINNISATTFGPVRMYLDARTTELVEEESLMSHIGETLSSKLGFNNDEDIKFVTGQGQVYKINRIQTPEVSEVELTNLVGNTFLQGKYARVYSGGEYSNVLVSNPSHNFIYQDNELEFDNVSVYYYGNKTLEWFDNIGIPIDTIITYHVHSQEKAGVPMNNAFYDPLDRSVHIGDGDGILLAYLAQDIDVISHETSHHFIYNFGGVHSLRGEAGAIHEGTADYIAYAIAGDPYLAESTPINDNYLRTANNTLTYPVSFSNDIHAIGDIWSGTLWQLRNSVSESKRKDIDTIVVKALAYLNPEAVFLDYANALLLADREYMNGQYKCSIAEVLGQRGFYFSTQKVSLSSCTKPTIQKIENNKSNRPQIKKYQQQYWKEQDEESTYNEDFQTTEDNNISFLPLGMGCSIVPVQGYSNYWLLFISLLYFVSPLIFRSKE